MIISLLLLFVTAMNDVEGTLIHNFNLSQAKYGWTLDNTSNDNLISVSATGMGFYAVALDSKKGNVDNKRASEWIRTSFDKMINLPQNKLHSGWLMHFVDIEGNPANNTEISTIDTAIFYLASERAAILLKDFSLLKHIRLHKNKIKLSMMMDCFGYFYHGSDLEGNKLKNKWSSYNEGVIVYKYFNIPVSLSKPDYSLPLFVFYYPLAFYFKEEKWQLYLKGAIDFQLEQTGQIGYTACYGPNGYTVNSPYVVSPLAVYNASIFFPKECLPVLHKFGDNPLIPAVSLDGKWKGNKRVLLDDGILLMSITKNY